MKPPVLPDDVVAKLRNKCEDTRAPQPAVAAPEAAPPPPPASPPPEPPTVTLHVNLPDYRLHEKQCLTIESKKKRKIVKAGRRGGKTTLAVILSVLYFSRGKRVRYAAPVADQTDRYWSLVKDALREPLQAGVWEKNETKRYIEPPGSTRQQIRAQTAWNVDTLRGDACDLLILEEYQLQDEDALGKVGYPMLTDYNGDLLIIFTPPSIRSQSVSKAKDKMHAAKLFKACLEDPSWLCVHFRSQDNPFVSEEGLEEVKRGMTRLAYRQEMLAEDVDEVPGALWSRKLIEDTRVKKAPGEFRRVVVGVDPSGSNTTETETGIVAVGEGMDGHLYIFSDNSRKGTPEEWARAAVGLYYDSLADRIIGEKNFGGAMVQSTLRAVDPNVSYKDVIASRSKIVRAQPVCALFEQGKAHIVGELPELEEQLVSYLPGDKSPDRMDAMVWACSELMNFGALGLVEFLKSDRAKKLESGAALPPLPIQKVMKNENLAVMPVEDTRPKCPICGCPDLTTVAGGQIRCQACGGQHWPAGMQPPAVLDARRNIILR